MIGTRLKEERERLGMNQESFAAIAGAKRRTLVDWEKGSTSPTAVQLAAFAEFGVDIQYVLTGDKSQGSYSEAQILEGITSFLFETAELGWVTKSRETPFNTVLNFALYSVKKAAGENVDFKDMPEVSVKSKEA